jgi:alkanesulfonate monooxygenase SsuD/methylene tetrahydromethanopterin reductase-like flavin-dependent oxidoreductase (luciferase family)
LWTQERANFNGKYYSLKDAICSPRPIQKPHPPIWIGGSGEKLTLRVVAELGDGCNFTHLSTEEFQRKIDVLAMHCRKVGRNLSEIKRSWQTTVYIAKTESEAKIKALASRDSHWRKETRETSDEHYVERNVVGTPTQCAKRLEAYLGLDVKNFLLMFPEVQQGDMSGLRLFAEDVIPSFNKR